MTKGNREVFQVDVASIVLADKFGNGFVNPRHFYQGQEGGVLQAQGLDNESMHQLLVDIEENGIRNPLLLRKITINGVATLQLVYGERRLRCALKLGLKCVPCYIEENMSDEEAWKASWRENDTAKSIGENATAAVVKHWREMGFSDEKILEITSRTAQWLRQMDTLGNLDPRSFDAYAKGLLSLRVALQLSMIENIDFRHTLLAAILEDVQKDHKDWLAKQKKFINKAEDRVETAEANLAAAEVMGADVESAKQEVIAAREELVEAEEILAKQEKLIPQAKNKNLNRASKQVGAEKTASSLTKAKLQKMVTKIEECIENAGYDEGEYVGDLDHLYLIKDVLNAILIGNTDFKSLLIDYYETLNAGKKEEDEDEVEDEDDDEDAEDEVEDEEVEDEVEDDDEIDEERVYDELKRAGYDE